MEKALANAKEEQNGAAAVSTPTVRFESMANLPSFVPSPLFLALVRSFSSASTDRPTMRMCRAAAVLDSTRTVGGRRIECDDE